MKSLGKYLIAMAAGAALVAGGGLAYSAAGAKYEPCRMTPPAPGVTQLCDLDSSAAAAANARGGTVGIAANGPNGSNASSGGATNVTTGGSAPLNSGPVGSE